MIVRALSVFERVVYHCVLIDPANPCRPQLEVDAVLREGDADGPLLLSVADYATLAGGPEQVRACLRTLADQGRIDHHLGVAHVTFPFWTPIATAPPPPPPPPGRTT